MLDEKNTIQPREVLAADDAEVSRLLKSLNRVEAPPDFDVRVRARIAKGRPQESAGMRFPLFVRYAAGLCAVIVFAGILGFVWLYKGESNSGPTVAGSSPAGERPRIDVVANIPADTPVKTGSDERVGPSAPLAGNPARPPSRDIDGVVAQPGSTTDGRPGSKTDALSEPKSVFPKGINPNRMRLPKPKEFEDPSQTPASDVLSLLGVGAKFSNGAWRVDSVNTSSSAERAGIKAGDVIEAVNDQAMREKASFKGAFTVRTLLVKRDGQTIKISLTDK